MEHRESQELLLEPPSRPSRWAFLEKEADGFGVVTRGMRVLYLNAAARSLVPLKWFGSRCWEIFPVGEAGCASRCQAIKSISRSQEITYCEEALYRRDGLPLNFGVAVIPVAGVDGSKAVLLFRLKPEGKSDEVFRREILARAGELRPRCEEAAGRD